MTTSTRVSVEEYLSTDYSPDVDYIDGEVVDRNVGESDHGRLQALLIVALMLREKDCSIKVFVETRVQIAATRFRVPDILVFPQPAPRQKIFTTPPFLCIEILSPEDRMNRVQTKIDDYLGFGVRYVWLVDPETTRAWVYTRDGITEVRDALRTENPYIVVPMSELMD